MIADLLGVNETMKELPLPRDIYTASEEQIVVISGRCRKTVTAILSDDIAINSSAAWQGFFGDVGGIGGNLGKIFRALNTVGGRSLQQPWMTRKQYQSSTPISFTVPMHFAAVRSAKAEVWDPVLALYSYVYPRLISTENGGFFFDSAAIRKNAETYEAFPKALAETVASLNGAMHEFAVPGPTPFGDKTAGNNDPIQLQLGVYGTFTNCYVTNVAGNISHVVDADGYPTSADVTVTVCLQDNCFLVGANGEFAFQNANDNLSGVTVIAKAINDLSSKLFDYVRTLNTSSINSIINVAEFGNQLVNMF